VLIKTKNGELWHRDREGSKEALVLRYANCSLRCYLCYAQRYAYLSASNDDVKSSNVEECIQSLRGLSAEAAWIRIQGGEPLINDERSTETARITAEALKYLSQNRTYNEPRVVVQTNGLWFARTSIDRVKRFVSTLKKALESVDFGRIVIEISFKGPNFGDANLYALSRVSSVTSVFAHQLQAFKNLAEEIKCEAWQDEMHRLAIYPVAGLGPHIENPGFVPLSSIVSSEDEELPLFHKQTWSSGFSDLVRFFKTTTTAWRKVYGDYLLKHGDKLPMEGMGPSMFQFGWISQISKRTELQRFVSLNIRANWSNRTLNLFKDKYSVLQTIIGQADSELVAKVSELKKDFYNSVPSFHYPYL
jgi:organic radical activating enzyme